MLNDRDIVVVCDVFFMSPPAVIGMAVSDDTFFYGAPRIDINIGFFTINPFVIKDFKAAPNKTVEIFKRKVRTSLENKIAFYGGTITSWVRDAFSRWDPTFSGRVASWKHMQGACKIFGFLLACKE